MGREPTGFSSPCTKYHLVAHWGVGRVLIWVARHPENFQRIGKVMIERTEFARPFNSQLLILKQTEVAGTVFYGWSMALGKLSILAMLACIFTLHRKWFKISIYFWATWTVLWWTASWFIIFLECRPLSTNWGVPTQCRPTFRAGVIFAVFNSVSDVAILILPQPMIWQLQLPISKKIGLSLVFLFGGLYVKVPADAASRQWTDLC